DYHHALYSRHLRWNGIHQHRGRVCGLSTGNINSGAGDRSAADTQSNALSRVIFPGLFYLPLVKLPNMVRRTAQNIDEFIVGISRELVDFFRRNSHYFRREVERIEAFCIFAECDVSTFSERLKNSADRLLNGVVNLSGSQ